MVVIDNYIREKILLNQIKKEKEFKPRPTPDGVVKQEE